MNAPPRRSLILTIGVDAVFPVAIVLSVFLLFAGHNAPGGGFVGGLVAGIAFVVRFVDGGVEEVERAAPAAPETLLGLGIAVAALTGASGWLGGGELLEARTWSWDVPVLGVAKLGTALFFDTGVYLVVVGLVLTVLRALGGEEAEQ